MRQQVQEKSQKWPKNQGWILVVEGFGKAVRK